MNNELIVGKEYDVDHNREGRFKMRITSVSNIWVGGVITGGSAKAIMDYNVQLEGKEIIVRKSFCKFKEIK